MREIYVNLEPYTCGDRLSDERVSNTQTSLLSLGFKRTRKGDDTSSSSDFIEPENADQHQDGDDECEDSTVQTQCFSECCNPDRDGPNQPTSSKVLSTTKRIQSHQARYVQSSWFSQYRWLTFCETRRRLFCFYCTQAENKKLITFSSKAEDAFSKIAFCNWKKASQQFIKHESSHGHSEACMKIQNKANIASMLSEVCRKEQSMTVEFLLKQLSSLKYLLRQGFAIRGHNEHEGNLFQLLKLRA